MTCLYALDDDFLPCRALSHIKFPAFPAGALLIFRYCRPGFDMPRCQHNTHPWTQAKDLDHKYCIDLTLHDITLSQRSSPYTHDLQLVGQVVLTNP